jgi:hypothetical protein
MLRPGAKFENASERLIFLATMQFVMVVKIWWTRYWLLRRADYASKREFCRLV